MPRKKGPKYYAVRAGRAPGIYVTWEECKKQVDGYKKPQFKSFSSRAEAESFLSDTQHPKQNDAPAPQKRPAEASRSPPRKLQKASQLPEEPSTTVLDSSLTYRLVKLGPDCCGCLPPDHLAAGALVKFCACHGSISLCCRSLMVGQGTMQAQTGMLVAELCLLSRIQMQRCACLLRFAHQNHAPGCLSCMPHAFLGFDDAPYQHHGSCHGPS